ncbi:MAG: hypothetical protein ACAI44_10885 [Candidatus Sericytochromatia bacterium]
MTLCSRLSLLLASSLLLGACNATSPLFYEPVNKIVQTDLPSPDGSAGSIDSRVFSFRVITPIQNVDVFSVLQAAEPTFPNQQNTLPVAQLKVVQVAKEKIYAHDYLNAEEASVLAFDAARQYRFDPEVARLLMVEILHIYAQRRDANLKAFRDAAESRAQFFIEKNRKAQVEYNEQSKAAIENYFKNFPITTEQQAKQAEQRLAYQRSFRKNYEAYMAERIARNKSAQDEYARQAKAAHERYLKELDEQTARARAKEKRAQELRRLQFEQILAGQKLAGFSVKDMTTEAKPYSLMTLSNGDFMLEASQPLPAVIQLQVDAFTEPVPIPVLPQTSHGRLLVSINQDAQGHPLVLGGMDADSGAHFDLNQVLFTIQTDAGGRQQLDFLYPDGHTERFDLQKLQELQSETALQQLSPEAGQLDALALGQKRAAFGQIEYQLTPELSSMAPSDALDVLKGLGESMAQTGL